MKKKLILSGGLLLIAITASIFTYSSIKKALATDNLLYANIEVLTMNETDVPCTDPKKQNIAGNIFCHCENSVACQDLFGCD